MRWPVFSLLFLMQFPSAGWCDDPLRKESTEALRKAVGFFREEAGYHGGYVYRSSADLRFREGEGEASRTTGWIEPPGTPFVGSTYLEAYRMTGEDFLFDAALEVAEALLEAQLESGGWAGSFELGEERKGYRYRRSPEPRRKGRNYSTLDDNKSQACLLFLMRLDETLDFRHSAIREALDYAFDRLFAVQYPNGAWPQQFDGPTEFRGDASKKARYPDSCSREFPKQDYRGYYTLNDSTVVDMMDVMLEAYRIYGEERFLDSAGKTGDFFLLAQMPEPQPGWAQQYNSEMEPAWARKFEPPAITGGESQGVMRALLDLYRATGEERYLEPLPRALEYYLGSRRKDGRLARFYELQTNRPLYFTLDYELTYSDRSMPTHYGFIVDSRLDRIKAEYEKLRERPPQPWKPGKRELPVPRLSDSLAKKARQAIDSMDQRGAWVENGDMRHYPEVTEVIETRTFAGRVRDLARYLSATRESEENPRIAEDRIKKSEF